MVDAEMIEQYWISVGYRLICGSGSTEFMVAIRKYFSRLTTHNNSFEDLCVGYPEGVEILGKLKLKMLENKPSGRYLSIECSAGGLGDHCCFDMLSDNDVSFELIFGYYLKMEMEDAIMYRLGHNAEILQTPNDFKLLFELSCNEIEEIELKTPSDMKPTHICE